MFRNTCTVALQMAPLAVGLTLFAGVLAAQSPERRNRIDVQDYTIKAEINPNTQTITAQATVRFVPIDDGVTFATFELNNALNVSRVVDAQGKPVQAQRNQSDFTVRLSFDSPLPKGQPYSATFVYDGRLTGEEESPVSGMKFAAIHPDYAYFLYPARWFPVNGYSTDRFGADMQITVPNGFTVVALAMVTPGAADTSSKTLRNNAVRCGPGT